ncbi:MAG TPA: hypothetical protein DCM05_00880 [Elusimicrobia bacterium]|nr:hypothetical protein [Elusimicrobiota bacterium]
MIRIAVCASVLSIFVSSAQAQSIESLRFASDLGLSQALHGARSIGKSARGVPAISAKAVIDDRVDHAKFLLSELQKTTQVCYSKDIIGRLKELTKTHPYSDALQRLIVAGLFEDLKRVDNSEYGLFVIATLADIASWSQYPVQDLVLRGIVMDVVRVDRMPYSLKALAVLTRVAAKSPSEDVKETAISLLQGEIRRVGQPCYSEKLLVLIDKIRKSR